MFARFGLRRDKVWRSEIASRLDRCTLYTGVREAVTGRTVSVSPAYSGGCVGVNVLWEEACIRGDADDEVGDT